jgi:hypothetical protein
VEVEQVVELKTMAQEQVVLQVVPVKYYLDL